jgi:hypothetical protein
MRATRAIMIIRGVIIIRTAEKPEESYFSPGMGHSGIGAPFPILIVMSLGLMRRLSFPICIKYFN